MYASNDAISVDRDPVHVYKMYKEKRPPSMVEPDSSFYLSVNYFKTETHASLGGNNWFEAQPMGVNKLHNIMKDVTQAVGISNSGKTNHSGRKTLVKKLQDSGVPPNQMTQIMAGHKNVQSVNNYSSLQEKQMQSISRILSWTTKAAINVAKYVQKCTQQQKWQKREHNGEFGKYGKNDNFATIANMAKQKAMRGPIKVGDTGEFSKYGENDNIATIAIQAKHKAMRGPIKVGDTDEFSKYGENDNIATIANKAKHKAMRGP